MLPAPRYLRFARSVALVSGVVLGGCGDRSHIPAGTTGDAANDGDASNDAADASTDSGDAGACECTPTDSGVRPCNLPSDPPCAVPGPLPPPDLPARMA